MDKAGLLQLPGRPEEQDWLRERLEVLTAREGIALDAAIQRHPAQDSTEVVSLLASLDEYEVLGGIQSYEDLGLYYLEETNARLLALRDYIDLDKLGRQYEAQHPGRFAGGCYVVYPRKGVTGFYDGVNLPGPDYSWSLRLKLASSAVPEGVWLRLPDYSAMTDRPDEVALALDELKTRSLENCMLLDVRCSLPELGNLMEQYDSALELVNDGSDLGYVLDEQGQGMPHFMERFAAALEFEHCRDLRLALDISQNLHCYEWVPRDGLKDFGRRKLLEAGVSEELLDSGCIDLEGYGADLLEEAGYVLTADESAYITRNNLEFLRDWSAPEEAGLSMEQQ